MKNNLLFSISIILLFSTLAYGQNKKDEKLKRVRIKSVYILPGINFEQNNITTLSDFKKLSHQSNLLQNDLSGYTYDTYSTSSNSMLSTMLGLQFRNKKKEAYITNTILRIGISSFSQTSLSNNLYKTDRKRIDTLTSNQTGQFNFIDSIFTNNYSINYTSQQLRLDASLIFSTQPKARWSLFGGIGITAGISINAYTDLFNLNTSAQQTLFPNNDTYNSYSNTNNYYYNERIKNKNNLSYSVYLPMAVDFRIGKNKEFWKQMHLFYELRPFLNTIYIPELRAFTNVGFQQGFGLKLILT